MLCISILSEQSDHILINNQKETQNMSSSFPKFVDDASGIVKVIFTNFTGELTAKEIIGLKKYVECPVPKQESSASPGKRQPSPPADRSRNLLEDSIETETEPYVAANQSTPYDTSIINESADDEDDVPPADRSRTLLEDTGSVETESSIVAADESTTVNPYTVNESVDDEDSIVHELQTHFGGLNVSVALDDDIEFEEGLSQQVRGRGGYLH